MIGLNFFLWPFVKVKVFWLKIVMPTKLPDSSSQCCGLKLFMKQNLNSYTPAFSWHISPYNCWMLYEYLVYGNKNSLYKRFHPDVNLMKSKKAHRPRLTCPLLLTCSTKPLYSITKMSRHCTLIRFMYLFRKNVPNHVKLQVRNKWEKLEHIGKVIFDIQFMIKSHAESMKKIREPFRIYHPIWP